MVIELSLNKVSSSEARKNFRDLLDNVWTRRCEYVIERNGVEVAAIIPAKDFQAVREELRAFRAATLTVELYNAFKAGRLEGSTLEDLEAELAEAKTA